MQIYIGNMNYGMSEEDLKDVFTAYGEVVSTKIIIDRDTGRSKGFGFVEMSTEDEARAAIAELDGKEVSGRNLRVSEAQRKSQGR